MHRTNPITSVLFWGLLTALGLATLAAWSLAQAPLAPAAAPTEEEKILRIPENQSRLVSHSSKQKIKDILPNHPDIVKVEYVKEDPFFVRLIAVKPGFSEVILTDEKGAKDKINVQVIDLDDLLFNLEKKKLDAKRDILMSMIREAVPSANVKVIIGLQRNKINNENIILTGSVVLTGTVFEAESIQTIVDLANAVFAGNAQPGQKASPPSGAQPNLPGTPPPSNTLITPTPIPGSNRVGGVNMPVGNNITIINQLRLVGVQQVELSVVVAVVNRSEARNMGFNWFDNRADSFITSFLGPVSTATTLATAIAGSSASSNGSAPSPANISFGVLKGGNGFSGFLQALRSQNLVKILAEPRVVALSGRQANFIDGGQFPVTSTGTAGANVTYIPFGTIINFLPIVLGNGKIHLEVAAQVSQPTTQNALNISTSSVVATAQALSMRGAQVAVQMEDGQTLAIGGLIKNDVSAQVTKVPVLGDMPFLGAAFRAVSYNETEEELVILVTPRLIDPMSCTQLPKYLPGRETRVAADFELFLEGIMEAPRGQRNINLTPHDYKGAHKMEGANGVYPCNDNSGRLNLNSGSCGLAPGFCPTGGFCGTGYCPNVVNVPKAQIGTPAEIVPEPIDPLLRLPPTVPAEPNKNPLPVLPPMSNNNFAPVQDRVALRPSPADPVQLPAPILPVSDTTPPPMGNGVRTIDLPIPPLGPAIPR